ncbi:tol-pal system protein YbgF [Halomonas sp. YLGW01]|uniref:tol-pal system protein YbgF n=1 Tax=Halomonas sp. YLGW01 TaxID=2773308 RepID=UPI0017817DE6|nr:tol-pal system protein YbgF [Halomonas sp. YLGW01]
MKDGLSRITLTTLGAGLCLALPPLTSAAPVVEDLSQGSGNFYQRAEVREESSGSLVLFNQVQDNQNEIKRLRGQIEELRYQLDQQRQLAQERYLDLEKRLEAGAGVAAADEATGEGPSGNTAANGGTEPGTSDEARASYQAAFAKVQARDFPAAISAFETFVADYPNSGLTANGHYWLGELYSAQTELEPASAAFDRVIQDFPQSSKVPDALYKLGLLRARQGKPEESRALLEQVRERFPESSAAGLANDFLNRSDS